MYTIKNSICSFKNLFDRNAVYCNSNMVSFLVHLLMETRRSFNIVNVKDYEQNICVNLCTNKEKSLNMCFKCFKKLMKKIVRTLTNPLVENIFLKLCAALMQVAMTYRRIQASSLWRITAPLSTFSNKWMSPEQAKLPAIASNIRAIRRTHINLCSTSNPSNSCYTLVKDD